jgi:hypothetical protein
MSAPNDPTYTRGKYSLGYVRKRDGTLRYPTIYIFWYDDATRRRERRSTGTSEIPAAEDALDRLFLQRERGQTICPTCGRPYENAPGWPVAQAISDYLITKENVASFRSIKPRLAHFLRFMTETGRVEITCDQVDDALIETFRAWSSKQPVYLGNDKTPRQRALGSTEGTVRQLAAAINAAHHRQETLFGAKFRANHPRT